MRVGFFQFDVVFGDKQANLQKVHHTLLQSDFDLVLLPELFSTGCLFTSQQQVHDLAEFVPDAETTQLLLAVATTKKACIVGGIVEKEGNHLYNTAVIVGPQGFVGKHRKVHLPIFDSGIYSPGIGFEVFEVLGIRLGILLCYDCWLPEAGKALVAKNVDLICIPVNFCGEDGSEMTRQTSQDLSVHTITANRLGMDHEITTNVAFIGASQIVNPDGVIIHRAGDEEAFAVRDIDLFSSPPTH